MPSPAPADVLPPLTGADLARFRAWLAVSQRALATKLGVEQSSISKGEGKPTTVLAPHLRKALHLAMQEPRDTAKGAS
ncbi:MAG: helix-turn-helix transcriptional regulator [Deltaproteobacteria bacterium]|nr:helix-turn-helix transcriptional regulator [Deltaproteobacteria bacterium]